MRWRRVLVGTALAGMIAGSAHANTLVELTFERKMAESDLNTYVMFLRRGGGAIYRSVNGMYGMVNIGTSQPRASD